MNKLLEHEFDNGDINHFTNYDYILQLCENGQSAAFKEFIKGIPSKEILTLLRDNEYDINSDYRMEILTSEILSRLK